MQTEEDIRATLARHEKILRELRDWQEIIDITYRFSRGVNRLDKELLRSVFHPDAIDDHSFFVGGRDDLLDWIDTVYTNISVTQHFVTNQTIDLDGDTAHVESYWFVANVGLEGVNVILRGGRYIDRFERREGRWAIAARACLVEWNAGTNGMAIPPDVMAKLRETGKSAKDKSDLSYQRPLKIEREPILVNPHKAGMK